MFCSVLLFLSTQMISFLQMQLVCLLITCLRIYEPDYLRLIERSEVNDYTLVKHRVNSIHIKTLIISATKIQNKWGLS